MSEAFALDVNRWRERLPSHIVDAIVFVRFCEDRWMANTASLRASMDAPRIHEALAASVRRMDERFHGWLRSASSEIPPNDGASSPATDALVRDAIRHFCDVDFAALPSETLGRIYESSLESGRRGTRKSTGVYYTPEHVVRYMVEGTIDAWLDGARQKAPRVRILDPACGSGWFLLGAFERLVAWHQKHRRPLDIRQRIDILLENVFGVDLDPRAVEVTKLSLALAALGGAARDPEAGIRTLARLDRNIRCGNSLVATQFDYAAAFPEIFADGGFDVVLGNPPYVSYGGRQAVALAAETRRYFERHYESGGWATAHSLFIERSAKELSRGLVSFIVPDQVGHLAGYRGLRELLAREGRVTEVRYWGENVFKGVVTPSLTFVLDRSKRGAAKDHTMRVLEADGSEHRVRIEAGEPWTAPRGATLLDKLRRKSTTIRPYLADCGVRTTDAKKQVVRLQGARGPCVPVLEGRQIGRYSCAPPEVAVRLAAGARVYMSRAEKYANARFLIRQTAAYPIVGPREHATYFRNSLHALYAPDNGWDVRYVVGLLNSKLLRFAYVATVREARQRAFPQVKLGPLGALPIRALRLDVRAEKAEHDRLVDLVARMLDLKHELQVAGESARGALRARADELDLSIDRTVFGMYELTDGEIASVEETVGTLAAPP